MRAAAIAPPPAPAERRAQNERVEASTRHQQQHARKKSPRSARERRASAAAGRGAAASRRRALCRRRPPAVSPPSARRQRHQHPRGATTAPAPGNRPQEGVGQTPTERRPIAARRSRPRTTAACPAGDPPPAMRSADQFPATPDRLHPAKGQQRLGEEQSPRKRGGRDRAVAPPAAGRRRSRARDAARQQRQRHHRRVDAEHQRHPLDIGVELGEDRGPAEGDDRGVGERQSGRDSDRYPSHHGHASGCGSPPCTPGAGGRSGDSP